MADQAQSTVIPVVVIRATGPTDKDVKCYVRDANGDHDISDFLLALDVKIRPGHKNSATLHSVALPEEMLAEGEVVLFQQFRLDLEKLFRARVAEEIREAAKTIRGSNADLYNEVADRIETFTLVPQQTPS